MKAGPLSVTISDIVPHLHKMSWNNHSPSVTAVSARSARNSTKCVSEQRPCTIYLQPFDFGRCIVSVYTLANRGAGLATTGGIKTLHVWRS